MKKVGDLVRVQDLFPTQKALGSSLTREATVWSAPFKIDQARDYAAVINIQHVSSVGPRQQIKGKLCVSTGNVGATAFTTVANSTFNICASGATQTKVNWARITMTGTITKITSAYTGIIIDGTTFTFNDTAHSSVSVHSTSGSVACAKLATSISGMCTYLETTYYWTGTATGPAIVEMWPKDGDRTFNIKTTSIEPGASADGLGIVVGRSAVLEFKAADIRNLSTLDYTHVAIKITSTGTVYKLGGVLLAADNRYKPDINIARYQLATVSSAYST